MTDVLTLGPIAAQAEQSWLGDIRFTACLPFTLKEEGGNSNDKHDPGGRTSRGIIQREYDRYRTQHGAVLQSVYAMSDAEMHDIYFHEYWQPHCNTCPAGLDLSVFDNAVNEGPFRAVVMLQRALGITADGSFGPHTQQHVDADVAPKLRRDLISMYAQERESFYRALSAFKYFGSDWVGRTHRIRDASLEMVT